jgi:hypothetical protein
MAESRELASIVAELIDAMHVQTKELEKLIAHIEQVTGRLDSAQQFSMVASELSGLHHLIGKLLEREGAGGEKTV